MQKLFLPLLFVIIFITQSKAQQRLFDQAVQLKTCNISIEANPFIATTVIEMEFYNPKDQEVEARQTFELKRGQVITDFQLELNGKYREGSIEEKWKAIRAYSAIVGKRVDPAILQMNWQNQYSINIYPVPAKSSRKIKFTITQMMEAENSRLIYTLPLNFKNKTTDFKLDIKINKPVSIPFAEKGLVEGQLFDMGNEVASLTMQAKDLSLDQPVSFSITQFNNQPQICINKKDGKTSFLMRLFPGVTRFYPSKPRSMQVYWDVSLSGGQRDLAKELDFLERYISENGIEKTTIILFNQQFQGIITFNKATDNFKPIHNYLLGYKYSGATDLGILDFSNVLSDAILLFSDGVNSFGNVLPHTGAVQVNCIWSSYSCNYNNLLSIVGNTGGSVIKLLDIPVKDAVKRMDTAENFLLKYNANFIRVNESFPAKLGKSILLSGVVNQPDNLELVYGNNTAVYRTENYFLSDQENCDEASYKKLQMLKAYDSMMYGDHDYYNWQNMVIFGLAEKVVTPQTSYLVLERVEDYIRYKIAPPDELKEKCAELNYVYSSDYKIKALKEFTVQESLELVAKDYNKRISWWGKNEPLIDLNKPVADLQNTDIAVNQPAAKNNNASTGMGSLADLGGTSNGLKEVVVTGAFQTKRTQRSISSNTQVVTGEAVNTIRQTNINNALAGKVAGLQVRSQSTAALDGGAGIRLGGESGLSSGSVLYVVDGTQMPNANDISADDVEDYTVLQGPAAAALYGPAGQNGVIVITLKKARRNYGYYNYSRSEYKLSSAEDEDYVKKMQKAFSYELWDEFLELEKENKNNTGFYFEMADFFFEKGKKDKAEELLYNAIDLCRDNTSGLKLAAYIYEKWKCIDKAIAVYKKILSRNEDNLMVKRDLALAYFQNKNYESAVKTYYDILTAPDEYNNASGIKENALSEMNAVLYLHKHEFDISYINQNLIKYLPVDLRITVENNSYDDDLEVIEPGNIKCNLNNANTINGGRLSTYNYYRYSYYYRNSYGLNEYAIKKAIPGNYKIKVDTYNSWSYPGSIPKYIRLIVFKNFQKDNMEMEIRMYDLDNQSGLIELDAVKW